MTSSFDPRERDDENQALAEQRSDEANRAADDRADARVRDEEALALLDRTALMMRGMTMDPAIPPHAKDALRSRITDIESFVAARYA